MIMSTDFIRRVVESFYADIWNRHDLSKIEAFLHPDFAFRSSLNDFRVGHQGFASYVDFIHNALGEYRCDILDLVIENEKAVARLRFSGIHQDNFLGYHRNDKIPHRLKSMVVK
ncbi:MAG: ester cyclase [Candidatus Competibacteraceae bacterium]